VVEPFEFGGPINQSQSFGTRDEEIGDLVANHEFTNTGSRWYQRRLVGWKNPIGIRPMLHPKRQVDHGPANEIDFGVLLKSVQRNAKMAFPSTEQSRRLEPR